MQINLQNQQEMQINLQNHREMQILICKIMSANANYSPPPRAKYVASIVKSGWAKKPENRFFALVSTGLWVLDCKRLSIAPIESSKARGNRKPIQPNIVISGLFVGFPRSDYPFKTILQFSWTPNNLQIESTKCKL